MYGVKRNVQCGGYAYPQNTAAMQQQYGFGPQESLYLPSGMPTGPTVTPMPIPMSYKPLNAVAGNVASISPVSETVMSPQYTQGFLRTQIGRRIKAEFLIGTNLFIDREGTLIDVGASYILIRETDTDDILLADIYSIKFVKFYY